jgi:hypothetical protein
VWFHFLHLNIDKSKISCIISNVAFDLLTNSAPPHPLATLPREDLDLITELVLKSGSLKDLASAYGVSYPTIRGRLDRVIERLRALVEGQKPDPLSELLARLVERGEIAPSTARQVREVARQAAAGGGGEGGGP